MLNSRINKMKASRIILMVLTIVLGNSCGGSHNNKLEYVEPVFEEELNANSKVLNNSFLFGYGSIKAVDTLIIYSGASDVSDKNFHLFSKKTGKYLSSFGNIGRSKGEISLPSAGFTIDKERGEIYVFDSNLRKTVSYSLDKVLSGDNDYAKDIELPGIVNNVSSSQFLYLKGAFLAGYSRSGRFLVCSEKDSVTCSDFYPSLDEPEQYKKVEKSYFFYLGCMSAKPDGKMFVHATRSGCVMEIWKNNGTSISPYVIKGFFKPDYVSLNRDMNYPTIRPNADAPYGISSLSCSNQYIYATYNESPTKWTNKIAVFDWKGNPQRVYVVNDRIMSFDVDNDNAIYALTIKDGENIELITIPLK